MKDANLDTIKNDVHSLFPECEIVLFGSRAKGKFREDSDYDLLVILQYDIDIKDKIKMSTKIRKLLLNHNIPADVLIQSQKEIALKKKIIGNIVRYAIKEGISI